MPADEDHRLLAEYRSTGPGAQAAFARLVERHVDLVYSVARRRVGDAHLAEDVTQAVFLLLARKAASIGSDVVIGGWLFNAARLVANNALKQRQRQRTRELSTGSFPNPGASSSAAAAADADWESIAPHLERAMDRLGRGERDAVLLRFYQGMSFNEVAQAIGISEDAASQRVSRGVAKLRAYFASRGVNTTADALTLSVAAHAVALAPAALKSTLATFATATAIATGAGAAGAGATGTTATTLANGALKAMAIANVKIAAAVTAAVVLTGTAGVVSYKAVAGSVPPPPRPAAAAPAPAPARAAATATTTTTTTAPAIGEIDPDMAAMLERKLPELHIDRVAASDVIDFLRDVTGANIFINWRAIAPVGATPGVPVSLNARDISMADALRQLITEMTRKPPGGGGGGGSGGGERGAKPGGRATFLATEGVIIITAADDIPRLRAAQQWRANMPPDAKTRAILEKRLPELNFDAIPFGDTIDFLRDVTGTNIFVNWALVSAAGVTPKRRVSVKVRDLPLGTCLWLLLESAQAKPDRPLDFMIDEKGVISISTPADLAKQGKKPAAAAPANSAPQPPASVR